MCIIGSECPERYVKCPTGFECIWYEYMCNGYSNCNDGSDESEEICKSNSIQTFHFRMNTRGQMVTQ